MLNGPPKSSYTNIKNQVEICVACACPGVLPGQPTGSTGEGSRSTRIVKGEYGGAIRHRYVNTAIDGSAIERFSFEVCAVRTQNLGRSQSRGRSGLMATGADQWIRALVADNTVN